MVVDSFFRLRSAINTQPGAEQIGNHRPDPQRGKTERNLTAGNQNQAANHADTNGSQIDRLPKIVKIPTTPTEGNYTRTDATAARWDYGECRKAMAAGYRGYVGIGLSIRDGLFGIDADHVLDENRQLS